MTDTSFIPGPDTKGAYRKALGTFATGVTVVTTQSPDGPIGMTVNSFASVSLDPPLVLWCPARDSLRHRAFAQARDFMIHVMADDQQTLAAHFATTGEDFTDIGWEPGPQGQPMLTGCLAAFHCRHHAVHDGGDHSIVVGLVLRAWHRPGQGLIFKRGIYGDFTGRA